ncbi:PVC-type heme-binding CxxCH protein [Fuerstiella marisgermanici]|uniref:Quinoprotein glucose dehydrogenase B n=1 Tax=Fuerstiella marisgermanici TaxID=1891926 RepID=A0A1P8WDA1_9PLAN|nr:PVC-type heme-binding CxxCH protein [Fuerstiella marisgermanici]APZ92040.1 Quinoprotein glucose dehydrogenase B precursor [Fuerstiella marisgermanici]
MIRILTAALFCCLPLLCRADEYQPKVAEASKDAELALEGFVLPDGIQGRLLAAEPNIANPVAFYVANDGRVFVCETFRQEIGVEDNRNHMDWLHNDLRLETVEERLAMFKKYLGHEVEKYATEHDRIRLLEDTNGDGTLDSSKVFAQGFNNILDGTGAGVLELDGNVYYTCIPKLWKMQDTDGDGKADRHEALHHGYGVRVAFRGHDMHGLVVGPDGRLYFSIGDRGYNVITKEGTRLKRPDSGAVFRCDLDGTNLEVFAYGLRNSQELAFDNNGNLFTVDNNSDSGDQARLVYVVQDSDSGWRMYYQYLDDRGPWNRERMWYPHQADDETAAVQPAYILPPIVNISDGPSGFTFYPGLGLADRYNDHFFLADFRGTAGNSGIRSFAVTPKGATFDITDSHEFIWSILATDVDFAPDGSLYVTDWVNGWTGEGKGRLYRFADKEHISAVTGANVTKLLASGLTDFKAEELMELLNHADRRVRQMAQFELVKREEFPLLLKAAESLTDDTKSRHVMWALWQFGLQSAERATKVAAAFLQHSSSESEITTQQLKIFADLARRHPIDAVLPSDLRAAWRERAAELTKVADLRVAGFAAVALGKIGKAEDAAPLIKLLTRNNDADPVLRHQAVMGLVPLAERSPGSLLNFVNNPESTTATQRALAVVFRRTDDMAGLSKLGSGDPETNLEVARALMDERTGTAKFMVLHSVTSDLKGDLLRRALEAMYRIGSDEAATLVAEFASNGTTDDSMRAVAAEMLKTWNNPQQTDTVNGRWRPLPQREVSGLDEVVRPHLAGMLAGPKEVRQTAIEVAAMLGLKDVIPTLKEMLADDAAEENTRVAAFKALANLEADIDSLLNKGRGDMSEAIRVASLELLAERRPEDAVPALKSTLDVGSVKAKQTALRLLGQINTPATAEVLASAFDAYNKNMLPKAVALDLLQASEAVGSDKLTKLVNNFRMDQKMIGTKVAEWNECLEGGNAERGRTVFFGRAAASCRRCHKVNGEGADVGPDLSAVAKDKDRTYLLEAIVDPNAKIAKGFETTIIVDINGRIHSGIIKEETADVVKLMTPKGAIITVATDDIDERAKGQSGMPSDITKALSREDVRDLVEFMAGLKTAKDGSHGKEGE